MTGLKARDPSYYREEKPPKLDYVAPIEERKGESITLVSDFETYRMNGNNETPEQEEEENFNKPCKINFQD